MSAEEADLADDAYAAVMNASRYSERALQQRNYQAGISDLGYCSERLRRMIGQESPDDTDLLTAFIGTALGDHMEQAMVDAWPGAISQAEVTVTLQGEAHTYNVTGHPDLVLPLKGYLIDCKTARGLALARRLGPNQQQQFQRHCYALGAHQAGLFGDLPLSEIKVANIWMDRAGDEREFHVDMEPYNPQVVLDAAAWLDEVVYDYLHGTESRKEPPREVCAVTCGFFSTCRASDVEGLIDSDSTVAAVEMYVEGADIEKHGKRLKDQARAALAGVNGNTGKFTVRWVHISGSHVEFDRRPSERLDIKPIGKG